MNCTVLILHVISLGIITHHCIMHVWIPILSELNLSRSSKMFWFTSIISTETTTFTGIWRHKMLLLHLEKAYQPNEKKINIQKTITKIELIDLC